jgi:hypothetical protein
MALACTAVLAGTVQPAFADATPVPKTGTKATAAPAERGGQDAAKTGPTDDPNAQVAVKPRGAADTGVADDSVSSGSSHQNALVGGGAAALVAAGGATFLVVRRRRATGA